MQLTALFKRIIFRLKSIENFGSPINFENVVFFRTLNYLLKTWSQQNKSSMTIISVLLRATIFQSALRARTKFSHNYKCSQWSLNQQNIFQICNRKFFNQTNFVSRRLRTDTAEKQFKVQLVTRSFEESGWKVFNKEMENWECFVDEFGLGSLIEAQDLVWEYEKLRENSFVIRQSLDW